ncbi:TspO/MBR family protein [Fodinibius halophilus]|uniref:Tryptophan-rich sensory protein n=1 Tax=Fodinibius halophilus TaxID=1736908 RepID=A0A6M1TD48_9BACT|nr:TspO/MBR family protein [Fodinibius halophilus]NGP88092.1 tryptophan-rich sensory protein [Fodinibius halophilus]
MNKSKSIIGLITWIIICSTAGIIGAQFDPGTWYELLQKPTWTPPNWAFPVVWPILYVMMGTAAWILWKMETISIRDYAFTWFFLQLVLNALWSWLFFGMNLIGTALAEIFLLWIAIIFTVLLFWRHKQIAGLLLLPYLLWVSYASALNFAIWQLN